MSEDPELKDATNVRDQESDEQDSIHTADAAGVPASKLRRPDEEIHDEPPIEWSAYYDSDGRQYYYNSTTGESSWEAPEKFHPPPADDDVDGQSANEPPQEADTAVSVDQDVPSATWARYEDDEGREYYYNSITGATQWDKPDGFDEDTRGTEEEGEAIEASDEAPMQVDAQTDDTNTDQGEETVDTPEELIDPEVKRLQDAESALERPDAVMEPGCLTHVHEVLSHHGPSVGAQKVTQALIDSYVGDTGICGLLGLWLAEVKSSKVSTDGATQEDSFNSAADSSRHVVQETINKIAKENFTKSGGDDILRLSKLEAAFLEEMIDSERWRKLLIELSATHKDSALLMYCLQSISKRGHHREIAKRVNQSDHFSVYNAMLASEFAVVVSSASTIGSANIGMDELVEDLRRTCTSTSYTYLYAIELLRDLVSRAESRTSADPGANELLQACIRKWNWLREELEGAMVDPSVQKETSGASSLFRKRRLDLALTMSDLHTRQRRRTPPVEDDEMASSKNSSRSRLESCLLKLLRKHAVGSPLDDSLLDQLLRDDGNDEGSSVGGLLIAHPLGITALLGHLFKPGSSRISSLVTRSKCARLIALSVLAAKYTVLQGDPEEPEDEEESELEKTTRMLLTASQLCELLENMVSFVVSRGTEVGKDASAGAKLCALALKSATIAKGTIIWATEITHGPEYVTSPSYPTLSPSILSLVRIVSHQHPFTRKAALEVAVVFLRHSNSEISYQKMNALKEQSLRLLLFLLANGEVTTVLRSIASRLREQGKSELDASLIRYFVAGLLEVMKPPFSLVLVRQLGALLTASKCMDALRSSYFEAGRKRQLVDLVNRLNDTVSSNKGKRSCADDTQLVSKLQTVYTI